MNTKELIETLKLQATFVNAGGYINQGNVMKEAAERLEELQETITADDISDEMEGALILAMLTGAGSEYKELLAVAYNIVIKHKKQS